MTPQDQAHVFVANLLTAPTIDGEHALGEVTRHAFTTAAEDFYRAGGTVTLWEWCLMPEIVREAFLKARHRIVAEMLAPLHGSVH